MKAVVCQDKHLTVQNVPDPVPGEGQLLVKVLRCGICGSDLHVRHHCDHFGQIMGRSGYTAMSSSAKPVVFGHEFSGEVLDYGPKSKRKLKPGTPVTAIPFLRRGQDTHIVGLSDQVAGAYAERVLTDEMLTFPIPNGLSPTLAALTEPMAVGWHAVRRGELKKKDVAIVIGCGPVGLATICMLKAQGVRTIIAADFSSARRALASACGATQVVDPGKESPYANWQSWGCVSDIPGLFDLLFNTRQQLERLPVPWWHTWRLAEAIVGSTPPRPVIFECVGAPGMLQRIIDGVPHFSRIVVVGVCMQSDQFEPSAAMNKEVDLRFAMGYSPLEFRDTLHMLAEGKVDVRPLVTAEVGLGGVAAAFDALGTPNRHAKILIDPSSSVTAPAV